MLIYVFLFTTKNIDNGLCAMQGQRRQPSSQTTEKPASHSMQDIDTGLIRLLSTTPALESPLYPNYNNFHTPVSQGVTVFGGVNSSSHSGTLRSRGGTGRTNEGFALLVTRTEREISLNSPECLKSMWYKSPLLTSIVLIPVFIEPCWIGPHHYK